MAESDRSSHNTKEGDMPMTLFRNILKLARRVRPAASVSRQRPRSALKRAKRNRTYRFEAIEPRLLMSAVAFPNPFLAAEISHPTFVIHHPVNSAKPDAATSSPTGDSPSTIRTAYGVNLAAFGSVTGDGTGQTIAIVDAYDEPTLAADVAAFDSYYSLPAISLTRVNETGGSSLPTSDS